MSTAERPVVVTGGSSGIGAAIVERLTAAGFPVANLDLNAPEPVDITDHDAVVAAVAAFADRAGPLYGLAGATEHPVAAERLTPAEAIARYTALPSRVGLHKREAGAITRDQAADLVVLSKDPLQGDFDAIEVRKTVVAGQVVFDAAAHPLEPA